GVAAGLFVAAGQSPKFLGLILPHGLLELTAISLAAAAGIQMGWALIAPGDRTRGDAVAEEGRRSVVIVLGLALAFIVAGTIEGFVTGSGLSTLVRVGIGVTVEMAFVLYLVVQGQRAAAMGETGLLGERQPHWSASGLRASPIAGVQ
ncbi:MAG TPA: stage II sporulation protein M, partial [Acidimicrobiales bacterium]